MDNDTGVPATGDGGFSAPGDVRRIAIVLLVVFGMIGGHRFYLGRSITGGAMLALFAAAAVTTAFHAVGPLLLGVLALWLCVDAAMISRMAARIAVSRPDSTAA